MVEVDIQVDTDGIQYDYAPKQTDEMQQAIQLQI